MLVHEVHFLGVMVNCFMNTQASQGLGRWGVSVCRNPCCAKRARSNLRMAKDARPTRAPGWTLPALREAGLSPDTWPPRHLNDRLLHPSRRSRASGPLGPGNAPKYFFAARCRCSKGSNPHSWGRGSHRAHRHQHHARLTLQVCPVPPLTQVPSAETEQQMTETKARPHP